MPTKVNHRAVDLSQYPNLVVIYLGMRVNRLTGLKTQWWKSFLRDSAGTGFWHETYLMTGGMEAIYDDVPEPIDFMKFAPVLTARGPMFGAAARSHRASVGEPVLSESELYER
jgi:hypothetical protein